LRKLLKLKEWLTVPDAARHLSILLGDQVVESDVFRLALDGHLTLSVLFVNPTPALCGRIVTVDDPSECVHYPSERDLARIFDYDERGDRLDRAKRVFIDDGKALKIESMLSVDGVWDLTMLGCERYYVEDVYQKLNNGPAVEPITEGSSVIREREGFACRIPPELPDGGLPHDSVFVIRTAALQELEIRISSLDKPAEKPLGKRERDNLLVIIAALAKMAKIDVTRPSKAAESIETQILSMGAEGPLRRAIEDHLKRSREALGDWVEDPAEH
jgi:hypothetical protein